MFNSLTWFPCFGHVSFLGYGEVGTKIFFIKYLLIRNFIVKFCTYTHAYEYVQYYSTVHNKDKGDKDLWYFYDEDDNNDDSMILKIIDNNQQDYQSRTATFSSRTTLAPLRASCRAAQEPFIPAPYHHQRIREISNPTFFPIFL